MIRICGMLAVLLVLLPSGGVADGDNRLSNGTFDDDVTGWDPILDTILMWDQADAGGDPNSGSARVTNPAGFPSTRGVKQCSDVLQGGHEYALSAMILIESLQPASGWGNLKIDVYPQVDCGGSPVVIQLSPIVYSATPDEWLEVVESVAIPSNGQSAWVHLQVSKDAGTGNFDVIFDNVSLASAVIFADGFESGDHGRWSMVVP